MAQSIKLSEIKQWCAGEWNQKPNERASVTQLSTDTRSLQPGDLFVAIRGESFDGHEYLKQAVEKGAAAALVERDVDLSIPTLKVSDSLKALVKIGISLRDQFQGTAIAITGSAGKSSTKEMLATLLGPSTVKSPASYNNLLGLSKTLWLLEKNTKNLVMEMGMNAVGEIAELCAAFRPEYGCITNIGDAHVGKVGSIEKVFKAKKEMWDYLAGHVPSTKGIALNIDDLKVVEAFETTIAKKQIPVLKYSLKNSNADIFIADHRVHPNRGTLELTLSIQGKPYQQSLPIFGLHHAQNIAAAVALARLVGVSSEDIVSRLPLLGAAKHRGEIYDLGQARLLIDESYNSNPSALDSSLTTLAQLDTSRRRLLVLGEMRELGEFSQELHAQLGRRLVALSDANAFPFIVIGVGEGMTHLVAEIKKSKPNIPWFFVQSAKEALSHVRLLLKPSDIIYVKGSRAIALEQIVESLTK